VQKQNWEIMKLDEIDAKYLEIPLYFCELVEFSQISFINVKQQKILLNSHMMT